MSQRIVSRRGNFRFVTITSEDQQGLKSLTNDMENVLARLVKNGELVSGDTVIYMDSLNIWDQVLIDANCIFVGFRSLNATSAIEAMSRVMANSGNEKA